MKRKTLPIFALIVAIATMGLVFAVSEAQAAPGQCFGVPPDAKDEDGSDGWDLYAPPGYVFTDAKVKAGTECYGDGEKYQITGIGTDHVSATRLCEEGPECLEISHFEGIWEEEPVCKGPYDSIEIDDTGWQPTETPYREVRVITYRNVDPDYPDLDCGEFEEYFYRWTICWEGETLVVPEEDLDEYPGYTPGSCKEEEQDIVVDPFFNCRGGSGGVSNTTVSGLFEWKFFVNGVEVDFGSMQISADEGYIANYQWNLKKNNISVGMWFKFTPDNTETDPVVVNASKTLNCEQKPPEEPPIPGGGGGSLLVIGSALLVIGVITGAVILRRRQQAI